MFGKHLSDEEKEKKSIACTGWKQTEEAKEKIRIAALERAAEKGIVSYNVDACRYIDEFNRIFGFQCQHALNGGETHIRGYSLDGYDKARGIIIEYDEPFHNKPYVKRKDLVRQEQIREAVKPVMFLRYDEQHHRLYDSLTGISIQKL